MASAAVATPPWSLRRQVESGGTPQALVPSTELSHQRVARYRCADSASSWNRAFRSDRCMSPGQAALSLSRGHAAVDTAPKPALRESISQTASFRVQTAHRDSRRRQGRVCPKLYPSCVFFQNRRNRLYSLVTTYRMPRLVPYACVC